MITDLVQGELFDGTWCQRWTDRRGSWRRTSDGGFDATRYGVQPIAEADARAFVLAHHYSSAYPAARLRYGLIDLVAGELVGVAVLGVPMSHEVLTGPFPGCATFGWRATWPIVALASRTTIGVDVRNQLRNESAARRLDNRLFAYFKTGRVIVAQTFAPGVGWQDWPRFRKTMTWSWARKLRRAGVTAVALTDGHRVADFTLTELLRGGTR